MKQEFKMEQQEMDDIIAINKNMPPVMKFGDYISGMDLRERINNYWEGLGKKYGFKPLTAEASSKGGLYFMAEPADRKVSQRTDLGIEGEGGHSYHYEGGSF